MENTGTHAHSNDGAVPESGWFDWMLELWRQAAAYFSPEELTWLAHADEVEQEQVEQLASWSLLPLELQEQILSYLPAADLCHIVTRVSRDMAVPAWDIYKRQPEETAWQQLWTENASDPTMRFATTQAQVNAAMADQQSLAVVHVHSNSSDVIELSGSRTVVVKVYGSTRIRVTGEGQVEVYDHVEAVVSKEIHEKGEIFALGAAQVHASGFASIRAEGQGVTVWASGKARIHAAFCTVIASGGAVVDADGSVDVTASGSAMIIASGEANTIRASKRVKIWAPASTKIIPSDWPDWPVVTSLD